MKCNACHDQSDTDDVNQSWYLCQYNGTDDCRAGREQCEHSSSAVEKAHSLPASTGRRKLPLEVLHVPDAS